MEYIRVEVSLVKGNSLESSTPLVVTLSYAESTERMLISDKGQWPFVLMLPTRLPFEIRFETMESKLSAYSEALQQMFGKTSFNDSTKGTLEY